MGQKKLFIFVGIWFLISVGLAFLVDLKDGFLNKESVTRLLVITYFLISLVWFYKKGQFLEIKNPKRTFILWSTLNALVMEVFHMISKPLHDSLLITFETPLTEILKNTSIDIILTFPAYLIIFSVMWQFIKRYEYSPFAFFFVMSLGQSLGDGQSFFILNPALLTLIPYVMIGYWAMNFIPYLVIRKNIEPTESNPSKFKKFILPIIILPITYFFVASMIITLGRILGWLPY